MRSDPILKNNQTAHSSLFVHGDGVADQGQEKKPQGQERGCSGLRSEFFGGRGGGAHVWEVELM